MSKAKNSAYQQILMLINYYTIDLPLVASNRNDLNITNGIMKNGIRQKIYRNRRKAKSYQ